MKPSVLLVITSDPRVSPKPAEAIRIAAGVGVWKKIEMTLYLRGAAILALSEHPDDLVDEDNYTRYLPMIGEGNNPIYVQRGAPLLSNLGETPVKYEEITDEQLATQAAQSRYVMHF
ncbi:MAG: hypothetical protein JWQ71_4578 [Pedosphaera sp.]|nr:hypothetical protein [Pedosphaera sp.]